jgi:hypothetical protein
MARGAPRLWGLVLGVPTIGTGLFALSSGGTAPAELGYPFLLLGAVTILIGLYVGSVSPEGPDVEPIAEFEPSQLGAVALVAIGGSFLVATIALLYFTTVPYVYPTVAFVGFVLLFVKGGVRYWQNSLTTYYVTDDRVISEYRFLALRRSAISHDDVTNVSRRQSVLETLTGLGSVQVTVAGSGLRLRDIGDPADAEQLLHSMVE